MYRIGRKPKLFQREPCGTASSEQTLTGVVQAVHALPAGQSGGLGLSLQRGVLREAPDSCLVLRALLWGVVAGEGER